MENKINFTIPEEVATNVSASLAEISTSLLPYLIALTPEERRAVPKMSDKTSPFVEKCMAYAQSAPEFAPPYMDVEGLKTDMAVYNKLIPLLRQVTRILNGLDDTIMQAGAESYVASLAYYNSVKQAAKMDIPGAKGIAEDLRKRFVKAPEKEAVEE